jgi:hypothetical protein
MTAPFGLFCVKCDLAQIIWKAPDEVKFRQRKPIQPTRRRLLDRFRDVIRLKHCFVRCESPAPIVFAYLKCR